MVNLNLFIYTFYYLDYENKSFIPGILGKAAFSLFLTLFKLYLNKNKTIRLKKRLFDVTL